MLSTDADCTCDEDDGPICRCCKKQLAKLWLNKVTRKVCKRPVMTSGYNSNAYGFTDQIIQDVMDKLNRRVVDPKDEMTEHPFAFGDEAWLQGRQIPGADHPRHGASQSVGGNRRHGLLQGAC